MTNHPAASVFPNAARTLARARTTARYSGGRGIRRIRRAWYAPLPPPTMEEVAERLRGYRGPFASITPEQWAEITAYEGPEICGNPNGPRRTF